jgi:hypothetical protein
VTKGQHNKTYKCKWCDHQFSGTKTRCYVHLTGEGQGVKKCSSITAAAQRAIRASKAQEQGKASSKRKADEDLEEERRSVCVGWRDLNTGGEHPLLARCQASKLAMCRPL